MDSPDKLWLIGTIGEIETARDELATTRAYETIVLPEDLEDDVLKLAPLLYPAKGQSVFVALKSTYLNALRVSTTRLLKGLRVRFESIISETSSVSRSAAVGRGVFVGPGCTVASRAVLEDFCVLEERCHIGRASTVGQYAWLGYDCSIAPGSILGPRCVIGPSVAIACSEVGADCEIAIPGRYIEPIGSRTHYLPELGGPIRRIA